MDDGSVYISIQNIEHADAPKVKGAIRMFSTINCILKQQGDIVEM